MWERRVKHNNFATSHWNNFSNGWEQEVKMNFIVSLFGHQRWIVATQKHAKDIIITMAWGHVVSRNHYLAELTPCATDVLLVHFVVDKNPTNTKPLSMQQVTLCKNDHKGYNL